MKHPTAYPAWSTTSFGGAPDTSPMELEALSEHLSACRGQQGRFLGLLCTAERIHGYVSARIVTSLVVGVTVLLAIVTFAMRGGAI
ncbi:MAG: hypothetical protein ABI434_07330 [Burkholderiaceae bacterium]